MSQLDRGLLDSVMPTAANARRRPARENSGNPVRGFGIAVVLIVAGAALSLRMIGGWNGTAAGVTPVRVALGPEDPPRMLPGVASPAVALPTATARAAKAGGEGPQINWYTTDGGGGVSRSRSLRVSGSIGQTDAGVSMAGRFRLLGGHWSTPAPFRPCVRDPQWDCDGDVDGDGGVNPVDLGIIQANFGNHTEQALCNYDIDCNGVINPVDSGIVQSLFGTCDPPREPCP
jgi:hypothetical protein